MTKIINFNIFKNHPFIVKSLGQKTDTDWVNRVNNMKISDEKR